MDHCSLSSDAFHPRTNSEKQVRARSLSTILQNAYDELKRIGRRKEGGLTDAQIHKINELLIEIQILLFPNVSEDLAVLRNQPRSTVRSARSIMRKYLHALRHVP